MKLKYTIKKLAQNSAFYTLANSVEAFSPVVLSVILTRIISPDEYGVWVLFIALVTFVRPFTNMSAQDAMRMHYFEMDDREKAQFVWASFCLGGMCTAALIAASTVFSTSISALIVFPAAWLPAIPITAFFYATFYFLLAFYQFAGNRRIYLYLQLVQTAASLLLIALLAFGYRNWQSIVAGKNAGLLVAIIFGVAILARRIKLIGAMCSWSDLSKLSRFGLMYLPAGIGMVAIPLTDRIIVSNVLGLAENGLFGAAALFGSLLLVVINGFLHAWMPWLFKALGSDRQEQLSIAIVSASFVLMLLVAGALFTFVSTRIAPLIIGQQFSEGFELIPWAIAGTVSMGLFFHNQAFLHYRKAIGRMSLCSLVCVLLNAYLSYYGAVRFGSRGVFAATVLSFLAAAALSGCFSLSSVVRHSVWNLSADWRGRLFRGCHWLWRSR